jgi:hypothetical protein
MKIITEDVQSPCQDLNPEYPEQEGVIVTCSAKWHERILRTTTNQSQRINSTFLYPSVPGNIYIIVCSCSQKFQRSRTHKQQRKVTKGEAVRGTGEVSKCCCLVLSLFYTQHTASITALGAPSCSVGIATRYRLDGSGIESRWGAIFFAPVLTGPGAHPASYTRCTWFFPGGVWRSFTICISIQVIKLRIRWAGHVARMGEKRGVYRDYVREPKGKRPLGTPIYIYIPESNIKMNLHIILILT